MNLQFFITTFYTVPILLVQLLTVFFLWRQTKDKRTWSFFVVGSMVSLLARIDIYTSGANDVNALLIASAITINTFGFISLWLLLKSLLTKKEKKI